MITKQPLFVKGRERVRKRGASPLSKISSPAPSKKVKPTGRLRGVLAPLFVSFPLSLRRREILKES